MKVKYIILLIIIYYLLNIKYIEKFINKGLSTNNDDLKDIWYDQNSDNYEVDYITGKIIRTKYQPNITDIYLFN